MPGFDDRLEQALQGAAVLPDRDPETVTALVADKHQRRRTRRRAAASLAVATVVVAALATTGVVVSHNRASDDVRVVTDTAPPPTVTPPPQPTATVPPEEVQAAKEAVPAAAPEGYEVAAPQVRVVASGEAVATVTDAAGTTYEGVRFTETEPGQWTMAPSSTCRLPGADAAACAAPPEVRVSPGTVRLDGSAYAGPEASVDPLAVVTDAEFARGPLVESNGLLWAAVYDRFGATYTFPPSHLVALDPISGAVVRRVDLEGEILSVAADGNDLWVLTHEASIDADQVEYRVKRIEPAATVPESMPIRPGAQPVGPIAAGDGTAWVPLRDDLVAYSASGRDYARDFRLGLPDEERRGLAIIEGAVYTTAGTTIRREEPDGQGGVQLSTGAAAPLTDLVVVGDSLLALAADGQLLWIDPGFTKVEAVGSLPPGMTGTELHSAGDHVWATGTADLAPSTDPATQSVAVEPVAVLIDDFGIETTLVVAGGDDTTLAVLDNGELVLTSSGTAYRVTLPE